MESTYQKIDRIRLEISIENKQVRIVAKDADYGIK